MSYPFILPLSQCVDLGLVGGKAVGLSRLIAAGFPVPPGVCITTDAYVETLHACGIREIDMWSTICRLPESERDSALAGCRNQIIGIDISTLASQWVLALESLSQPLDQRWAVRSSATNEDAAQTSFAGLYQTRLGRARSEIEAAIKKLWASIWEERVVTYMARKNLLTPPRMAVLLQPMVAAQTAGVAYSIHPVTGRRNQVMINAVPGLAAPLVEGSISPDQYVIEMAGDGQPAMVRTRVLPRKPQRLSISPDGLQTVPIEKEMQQRSSLTDAQLFSLTNTAKQVEQAMGHPVDLEWAYDTHQLWLVQARPITHIRPSSTVTNDDCEWSRTNFKETLPELPSPLSLSFLEQFMDRYIIAHYRRLGCHIPDGLTSVRILKGRPYLNVTLFHMLVAQLGGDPSMNAEQMGGAPLSHPPEVQPLGRLTLMRARWCMLAEMRRVERAGPRVFQEMKELATMYARDRILSLSVDELVPRLNALGPWLDGREVTFGIAGGVGQCLQILGHLLPRWLGLDWRELLNTALQGQGTVISAQQILRLAELTDIAREEPNVRTYLTAISWDPTAFRSTLADTKFLRVFQTYLEEYGHRGVGESDVMSPRLADNPEAILAILRTQLLSSTPSHEAILARQEKTKVAALSQIKARLGWRIDRWMVFLWCYRRLCRFFALRESNRHHLMYYTQAIRTLLIRLGELLVEQGRLDQHDDIFFLSITDRTELLTGSTTDWKTIVRMRRMERTDNAEATVPDTIQNWESVTGRMRSSTQTDSPDRLTGMPISAGSVLGPVRLIRSVVDWNKVVPGDILVVPVIDPGLAPLFGIAGGLIAEMGGTLSHGAIIAREYGLPTVANVDGAMSRLSDGLWVRLDAGSGTICIEPPPLSGLG
ncbi:MAG: PEP/pyruvate-binding domain-containing protein [Nitrospira sp.]